MNKNDVIRLCDAIEQRYNIQVAQRTAKVLEVALFAPRVYAEVGVVGDILTVDGLIADLRWAHPRVAADLEKFLVGYFGGSSSLSITLTSEEQE
ncbi:MAG: hypothetical protein ACRC5T_04325 [Cetobacterium sp.]